MRWIDTYRGERFWEAHHNCVWSRELLESCLSRSHTLAQPRSGFNHVLPTLDEMKSLDTDPIAYQYEHNDGLKSTMILLNGVVRDFNFAAHLPERGDPLSTQMYLPMPPAYTTLANFFSPQVNNVEQMFLTGKSHVPR